MTETPAPSYPDGYEPPDMPNGDTDRSWKFPEEALTAKEGTANE